MTDKQNPVFVLNDLQEQILLSGKLGDGNFKKNGSKNYYYRENHAEDEKQYLEWKMNVLGKNIVAKRGLYKIKMSGYNQQQPYGFSTKTSPTFITYNNLSIPNTISKLDYRGLIMFMLDDGWFSNHSKEGNFCISGGNLTVKELEDICSKFDEYGINNTHVIGIKRNDICIPSKNNAKLYEMAISFIPKDIDIINKKFYKIMEHE